MEDLEKRAVRLVDDQCEYAGACAGVTKALAQLAGIEPDRLGLVGQDDVGRETETEQVAIEAESAFDVGDDDRDVVEAHSRLGFDFGRVQIRKAMRLVLLARACEPGEALADIRVGTVGQVE